LLVDPDLGVRQNGRYEFSHLENLVKPKQPLVALWFGNILKTHVIPNLLRSFGRSARVGANPNWVPSISALVILDLGEGPSDLATTSTCSWVFGHLGLADSGFNCSLASWNSLTNTSHETWMRF
jgi:hypothetical protein